MIAVRRIYTNRVADEAVRSFVLPRGIEIALALAVFALAAFFRFWDFQDFPAGLWYDEAVNGTDAFSIMDRDHFTVWRSSNFGHSTIYFYLLIGSFKVFGYTITAMRMVPALAGLAAVVAFYFLARWLLGPIPALVATALLAVSRWAVTFSRVSWEASLQPVLEIMAVFFFVKALDTKTGNIRWFYWFMAGGSLAAGVYTYLAFRFVPIVMLFFILYIAVTSWRLLWQNRVGLVVYAVSFLVVFAPLGQFALRNQDLFLERTREINVFREIEDKDSYDPLKDNFRKTAEMMNVAGDANGRHNLPGEPMVDEITAALLVLGFAAAIWSFRNWRKGTVAGWFVLALLPSVFTISVENPSAIRTVGAIPPLYLLAGLAVATIYRPLMVTKRGAWVFAGLVALIIPAAAAINFYDLYERQAKSEAVYQGFQPEFTQVARVIAANADDMRVIATPQFSAHQAVTILTRGKQWETLNLPRHFILGRGDRDVMIILDVDQFGLIPVLQTLYPNMTQDDYVDQFDRVFFTRLTIPQSDIQALHDLGLESQVIDDERAPIDREWTAEDLADGPVTVTWSGYLWVPSPGAGFVVSESPGAEISMRIGEQEFTISASGQSPQLDLELGEHPIELTAVISQPGRLNLQWASNVSGQLALADATYGTSAGEQGFQVVIRSGDFASPIQGQGTVPFTAPLPQMNVGNIIEYVGVIDVSSRGEHAFAITGASSSQLFVDGELVVDNGGGHARTRIESSVGSGIWVTHHLRSIHRHWRPKLGTLNSESRGAPWSSIASKPPKCQYPKVRIGPADRDDWPRSSVGRRARRGRHCRAERCRCTARRERRGRRRGHRRDPRCERQQPAIVQGRGSDTHRRYGRDAGRAARCARQRNRRAPHRRSRRPEPFRATIGGGGAFSSAWGVDVDGDVAYVASPSGGLLYAAPLDGSAVTLAAHLGRCGAGARPPAIGHRARRRRCPLHHRLRVRRSY